MSQRDRIDSALAKHFAWAFARPGETVPVAARLEAASAQAAEAVVVAVAPVDEAEGERWRETMRAACRPLAAGVSAAWALEDEEGAARAVKRLLGRADRLAGELVGMDAHPAEAVRLVRLFVRHGPKMTRRQRERACAVAALVPLAHPETADLFVEVARAGDREMARALGSDEDEIPDVGDEDALVARLADVVDSGPTHGCRAVAIELLAQFDRREAAIPALRRALSLPSFAVRARALSALATARPCAVAEDDLVRVLRDLVAHGPPDALLDDEREEEEHLLAEAVVDTLAYVQPPEVEETLLDLIDAEHEAIWLDAGWATEALAVAFPETAAAMVDHWLKCARAHERVRALSALERLPTKLAEPRLRLAMNDPAYAVREPARRQWLDRFERACPVEVADIVGASLLEGAPSERFASRLAVMQGRLPEARRAMARALVAEAPQREALVLLLQLIGEDAESGEPSFAARGQREEGWAATVAQRFGAPGVEALCALAARFPEPESFGWMRRLGDLVEQGAIAPEYVAPLRDLAASHVGSTDAGRVDDALRVLSLVGAPPELIERVLALGLDDDLGSSDARTLVVSWPVRAIDTRLASEMALALAERDWTRLRYAAWMALERGAPAGRVIAQRVLEVAEQDADAADAAVECARQLRKAGALSDAWALAALARPASPIFDVAARAWRGATLARGALEAALQSRERGGLAAAQAAVALLHGDPGFSPRDRRLVPILEAIAPAERAELVHAMCMHGPRLSVVGPHLEVLAASGDASVTGALVGIAHWLGSPRGRALLRRVLPRVLDRDLRADIEDALGTPAVPYWAEG